MNFFKSKVNAQILIIIAFLSLASTAIFRLTSNYKPIKKVSKNQYQTKTYALANEKGINLSINLNDLNAKEYTIKLFNISPYHWIMYLNQKIGMIDVNTLINLLSTIIKDKHFGPFLWELVKLVEIGRMIRFDVVEIKVEDGVFRFNGNEIKDVNYVILLRFLIDAIIK